jgi:DNA-binding PadR family transcriptional regulator
MPPFRHDDRENTVVNEVVEKRKRGRPKKNPDVTDSGADRLKSERDVSGDKAIQEKEKSDKDVADEKVEKVKKSSVKKGNKVRENEIAKNNNS